MLTYIHFFNFKIPSYGLCMASAFILCCFLAAQKSLKLSIDIDSMIIVFAAATGMSLFGGGLLYTLITYSPQSILNHIKNLDFSFIKNSGLVFYGGLAGGIAGALISAKLLKLDLEALDGAITPFIPLGHSIGRVGCMLAGCCHGFEYDGIFAVKNYILSDTAGYFPIQLLEAALDLMIMLFLFKFTRKKRFCDALTVYLFMYSLMRFFTEFLRGDDIRGKLLIFSTSQWISIFIVLISAIRIIHKKVHIQQKR